MYVAAIGGEVELGEALTLLRRAENQAQGFRQQMEDATDFEDHGVTLYRPLHA